MRIGSERVAAPVSVMPLRVLRSDSSRFETSTSLSWRSTYDLSNIKPPTRPAMEQSTQKGINDTL